jgi:hypothetical protein
MFRLLFFVAFFSLSTQAYGGSCLQTEDAIQNAQDQIKHLQKQLDGGNAVDMDVLLAKKHLFELRVCKTPEDYASYYELAENVASRLTIITNEENASGADAESVIEITAEANGMAYGCQKLVQLVTKFVNGGFRNPKDLDTVKGACDLLPKVR